MRERTSAHIAYAQVMLLYGSIAVAFFSLTVAMSLAELSSAYPTSGGMHFQKSNNCGRNLPDIKHPGQYHWTAELAPKGYGPVLSWFCGYFNSIGWCVVSASVIIATS
jgi:choline transport protein